VNPRCSLAKCRPSALLWTLNDTASAGGGQSGRSLFDIIHNPSWLSLARFVVFEISQPFNALNDSSSLHALVPSVIPTGVEGPHPHARSPTDHPAIEYTGHSKGTSARQFVPLCRWALVHCLSMFGSCSAAHAFCSGTQKGRRSTCSGGLPIIVVGFV
jgi:hypothetical protein